MVKPEELQKEARALSEQLGLPTCEVIVHIKMDDYIGIFGEKEGGCMVLYEVANPERYCVAVENTALKNDKLVYDTLKRYMNLYKKFLDCETEEE